MIFIFFFVHHTNEKKKLVHIGFGKLQYDKPFMINSKALHGFCCLKTGQTYIARAARTTLNINTTNLHSRHSTSKGIELIILQLKVQRLAIDQFASARSKVLKQRVEAELMIKVPLNYYLFLLLKKAI